MKKFTSTLFMLLACLYLSAQPGTLDGAFNASGTAGYKITDINGNTDVATAMAVSPIDGSIYVTGYTHGTDDSLFIIHYLKNGTLDGSFGTNGIVTYKYLTNTTRAYAIGLQSTGNVVVAGWSYPGSNHDFFVGRFDGANGSLLSATTTAVSPVSGISGNDEAHALAIQSNDEIVVAGYAHSTIDDDIAIAHYTSAGALDNTFNSGGTLPGTITQNINTQDYANAVAIDKTSGDIIVAGTSNSGNALSNFTVLRYTSGGALNTSFNTTGILIQDVNAGSQDEATAVAIAGNGDIIVAGTTASGGPKNIGLVRLSSTGTPVSGFGSSGIVVTNFAGFNSSDDVDAIAIQSDNKIVVGGTTDSYTSNYDLMLLRYTATGGLDGAFGSGLNGEATLSLSGTQEAGAAMKLSGSNIYIAGTQSANNVVVASFANDAFPLPLTLTQFYAQKQTSKVVLQWQTQNEENVQSFIIERSTDGKTYHAIGQVAATGSNSSTQHYSFADAAPFTSTNNYYRLLMVDNDGSRVYSKILTIKFGSDLNLQIFPSPVKDNLQVQLPGGLNGNISLQIVDLGGRVVKQSHITSDGSALSTSFDVNNLIKGVYIFRVVADNSVFSSKFVKQ